MSDPAPRLSTRRESATLGEVVEDGLGVSILLEDQVAPAIADGRLIRLDVDLTPMHRILARSPAAPRAAEMLERLFIEEVRRQSKRG